MVSLRTQTALRLAAAGLASAIICFTSPGAAFSQEPLTLGELEKMSLETSSLVAVAQQKVESAQRYLSATRLEYGPQLSASYRFLPDRIDLTADELSATHSVIVRVGQDLVELAKTRPAQIHEAMARLETARIQLQTARAQALYDFRRQYLDLLRAKATAEGQQRLSELCSRMLLIVRKQLALGEALLPEVYSLQRDSIRADGQAAYNRARAASLTGTLAATLDLDTVNIAAEPLEPFDLREGKTAILRLAEDHLGRQNVFAANGEIERSRYANAAYRDFHLMPYLGYRYRWKDIVGSRGSAEAGIKLSFPLLFPASRSRRAEQFQAAGQAWQKTAEQALTAIRSAAANAFDELLLSKYKVAEAETGLRLQRELLRIETAKDSRIAKTSSIDRLRLLKLEMEATESEIALRLARAANNERFYALLKLCGLLWPSEILTGAQARNPERTGKSRAIWVWDANKIIGEHGALERLATFCRQKTFTRIFLSVNSATAIQTDAALRNTVLRLHEAGAAVSALIGDPAWVYPRNRDALIQRLRFISRYNADGDSNTRFDAVHLDIEPQALPEWEQQKKPLLGKLLETVSQARDFLRHRLRPLRLEIDLPVSFDTVDSTALSRLVMLADEVTVMAYHRTTVEALREALRRIPAGSQQPLLLGLNIDDFSDEAALEALTQRIAETAGLAENLAGVALHDYARYQRMAKE